MGVVPGTPLSVSSSLPAQKSGFISALSDGLQHCPMAEELVHTARSALEVLTPSFTRYFALHPQSWWGSLGLHHQRSAAPSIHSPALAPPSHREDPANVIGVRSSTIGQSYICADPQQLACRFIDSAAASST